MSLRSGFELNFLIVLIFKCCYFSDLCVFLSWFDCSISRLCKIELNAFITSVNYFLALNIYSNEYKLNHCIY